MNNFEYCQKIAFEELKCNQITTGVVENGPVTVSVETSEGRYILFESKKEFVDWVRKESNKKKEGGLKVE
jgi:hypothetical protein